MKTGVQLIEHLNLSDECNWIEAKRGQDSLYLQNGQLNTALCPCGVSAHTATIRLSAKSEPVLGESEPAPAESEPVLEESERVRQSLLKGHPCAHDNQRPFSISELPLPLGKGEKQPLNQLIKPLREAGRLSYTIPDMPNHPRQAYTAIKNKR